MRFPNRSTWSTSPRAPRLVRTGSGSANGTGETRGPREEARAPVASRAAAGAKMSRPSNVVPTRPGARSFVRSIRYTARGRSSVASGIRSPLSGPTSNGPARVSTTIGCRWPPTPGSTTATCTDVRGNARAISRKRNALSRTPWAGRSWARSTSCPGRTPPAINAAFIWAAYAEPMSVVRVTRRPSRRGWWRGNGAGGGGGRRLRLHDRDQEDPDGDQGADDGRDDHEQ